jgi:hypothetical protein
MAAVTNYSVLIYGSPSGYQTNRAQIQLTGNNGNVLAWIRFNDPGQFFEEDKVQNGIIHMHLPSSMFDSVMDMLRNEQPLQIYFASGRAFFGTTSEPVGEEES